VHSGALAGAQGREQADRGDGSEQGKVMFLVVSDQENLLRKNLFNL
jgi:hypothetical protein